MYKFYPKSKARIPLRAIQGLRIMKTIVILTIFTILQASAFTKAQNVTLSEKNASLKKVFLDINKQTGYDFLASNSVLKAAKPVNIDVKNQPLKTVLDNIFTDQPLQYVLQEKMVIVSHKPEANSAGTKTVVTPVTISGKVIDSLGSPLPGATLRNLSDGVTQTANAAGEFTLQANIGDQIQVTFIGYSAYTFTATENNTTLLIKLFPIASKLNEVSVISTGYQLIPKERSTGSFTQVDNNLLNRSTSTAILDRLNGVTSGLIFNNNNAHQFGQANIEIRGRATIFSNANPLIIIDNFPYDGDLSNINPNDVENISILKDAAAASAWGSRSGNGVIVITTKKGRLNRPTTVSFNATTTIGERPDLFYTPQLSSEDYINVQQFLFRKGAFNSINNNGYSAIPPAVQIFYAKKNGTISAADSLQQINALKGLDVRDQIRKYYYRPSVNQQYLTSISGGSSTQKFYLSAGYDKNLNNLVNSDYSRVTVNAANTYYFLANRLELFSSLTYTSSKTNNGQLYSPTYPYLQIADSNGQPLPIANTLRISYASTAGNGKLLNWLYEPLDELRNNYSNTINNQNDIRLNFSLSFKVLPSLKASLLYSYERGQSAINNLNELQSFYARNLINTYAQLNTSTGDITNPIPIGGILNTSQTDIHSNDGRFQLSYEKEWGKHALNAIAGTEIDNYNNFNNSNALYGYNPETSTNLNSSLNFVSLYKYFYNSTTARISPNASQLGITNRFVSEFFNGSYIYDERYIASLSGRRDESNLFGVSENQKGIPLWSAGLAWIIDKESFYKAEWLPKLKIRATYGYTGNVNTSVSAYLTAVQGKAATLYNAPYSQIVNPPNPSLRWEKDRNIDLGVDFSLKNDRIFGSIDYYQKKGEDLIGSSPTAPQTGVSLFTGNSANTKTKGLDIQINTINLTGPLIWKTTLLLSHVKSIVTKYDVSNGTNLNVVSSNYNNPLPGFPYYAIFSFKYAGLNSTGDPQGFLNGKISTDYSSIMNSTDRTQLVYKGSASPTYFGSIRNTFAFKEFDLSLNVVYKLGYYFRRNSLNNNSLYSNAGGLSSYQQADYNKRWQNPGDELVTNVPSLIYPANASRTNLYTYSDALVERGDHIRIQDLRLGYTVKLHSNSAVKSINLFTYLNNIGILWRANKERIDPDYPTGTPLPRTLSIGLKTDL
ncbi:TonB-linked outer membrane protein, SusC/RagA family [Mucilaginibacter gossypiicola]|uniref:TonB-linked outer membrane protein, SusC/RagA family n=1 Tax=Mucilaginibacter gossypiicola TaxID=551995 RepID=A0A1H8DP68_9SPHI|nr:SusC/RagA family TonB-linked outer membrane protein [Mucilaginibacter gossypiicola]SEN08358.1 TonB-linked outer membrane protein, SusC/RagA family [Mucilaginibacter gossypiicola]